MIIESLLRLGARENVSLFLEPPRAFPHVAIHLRPNGSFKLERVRDVAVSHPVDFGRTSNVRPYLLMDSIKFLTKHQKACREFHKDWAARCPTGHPAAQAVTKFFERQLSKDLSAEVLKTLKAKASDFALFYFEGKPLGEFPELHSAIAETLEQAQDVVEWPSQFDDSATSLRSTHAKISLPGLDNKQSLLTFDRGPTHVGGLAYDDRMLHAAMSYQSMRTYVGALQWLLKKGVTASFSTAQGGVTWVGWSERPSPLDELVPLVLAGCPKDEHPKAWQSRMKEALEACLEDSTPHYHLAFLCTQKIIVRDFSISTVGEVARRLLTFREDFRFGQDMWASASLFQILRQTAPSKKSQLSLAVVERTLKAVFAGAPYPESLLKAALVAVETSVRQGESWLPPLAEATLHAHAKRQKTMTQTDLTQDPFFILGRIFGLYEERNYRAKAKTNTVSITGMLGRFVTSPAAQLNKVIGLAEHHKAKLLSRDQAEATQWTHEVLLYGQMIDLLDGPLPQRTTPSQASMIHLGRQYQNNLNRKTRHLAAEATREKDAAKEARKKAKETKAEEKKAS